MKKIKKKVFDLLSPRQLARLLYLYNYISTSVLGSAHKLSRRRSKLISKHSQYFIELKKNGYVVIPNYLSQSECAVALTRLKELFEQYPSFIHETDDRRIFGIEQLLPAARKFAQERDFLELGELINREYTYCAFTLAGWLQAQNGGSSGNGWHRDALLSQFKAMIYLTDVTDKNGPFEILPGSHKQADVLRGIAKAGIGPTQDRLSEQEVSRLEDVLGTPRKTLVGDAGSMILFNSSAVHRGRPINNGERFALTNYYFPISRDPHAVFEQFSPVVTAADVY